MYHVLIVAISVLASLSNAKPNQFLQKYYLDMVNETTAINELDEAQLSRIIFPGTKWCGPGHDAESEYDLGYFSDTDTCCRAHDFCPDNIPPFQTKHNLTNVHDTTRSHCNCDHDFRNCLKQVKSHSLFPAYSPAQAVGYLYFTYASPQCFEQDFPIVSCIRLDHQERRKRKCIYYNLDPTKKPIYQWFDTPDF